MIIRIMRMMSAVSIGAASLTHLANDAMPALIEMLSETKTE